MIGGRTAETTCFLTSQNRLQTEMEASICRKFKFSLRETIFIHETTSGLITQGEIDGTTQLLPRLGRLTIDVCVINNQSTHSQRRIPNRSRTRVAATKEKG